MKNGILFLNLNSDNHGQKFWDEFTFVAPFQTRQTNSHARIHLHLVSPRRRRRFCLRWYVPQNMAMFRTNPYKIQDLRPLNTC